LTPAPTSHQPGYPPGHACWFDLVTHDPAAASTFYSALSGWQITPGFASATPYLVARIGGRTVAGISTAHPGGPPTGWTVYFACSDAFALSRLVERAGGTVLTRPAVEGADGASVTFRDPAGAVAGAWQAGRVAGAQLSAAATVSRVELCTTSIAVSQRFYPAVFGVDVHADEMAEVATGPSRWVPYFEVTDVEAHVADAMTLGATLDPESPLGPAAGRLADESTATGPTQTGGWYGRVRLIDPQGARFGLSRTR
jgi:predicted enzyme related to lactoylglutathione lyase